MNLNLNFVWTLQVHVKIGYEGLWRMKLKNEQMNTLKKQCVCPQKRSSLTSS